MSLLREIAAYARQASLLRHDVGRPVLPQDARHGDDVVVCLHGFMATAGVLRPIRKRLEAHDGVHTATMTYGPGPGITTLARRLHELLFDLGEVRIHLLGHSLGGAVCRWLAQEMGDRRIAQTISLATPFAGVKSHVGAIIGFEVAKEMDPQSAVLRQLRLGSARALGVPHLSIVAENDQIVAAPMSHVLPGGEVLVIRRCGHNALLYHDQTVRAVERQVLSFADSSC